MEAATRALIIAIAAYDHAPVDPGARWQPLASAADAELLSGVLRARGVEDVSVLADEAATAEGIVAAFRGLGRRSGRGDHLLIHYSGHGQQITDGSDHDELDGYDEALVPFDAPAVAGEGYGGERHLRDDTLHTLIEALRARVGKGGSVTVTLDACHSGSATRGGTVRGGTPMDLRGAPPAGGPPAPGGGWEEVEASGARAPLVVISAARSNQVAAEVEAPETGRPQGALSHALALALGRTPTAPTWAAVFDLVQQTMARTVPGQIPQAEGDLRRGVFGAADEGRADFHRVVRVDPTRTQIEIDGGQLHGLSVDARVEVHAAGAIAPQPATLLSAGSVLSTDVLRATVHLDRPLPDLDPAGLRVWVTEWRPAPHPLAIALDLPDGPRREALLAALAPLAGRVEVVPDRAHAVFTVDAPADRLRILQNGNEGGSADLHASTADGADPAALAEHLLALSRAALLRDFSLDSAVARMELQLVAAEVDAWGACRVPPGAPRLAGSGTRPELPVGSVVALELTPRGAVTVYATVLYIDATGRPVQLYPRVGEAADAIPPGGAPVPLDCVRVREPLGLEQILVIASRSPVDLGPLLGYARAENNRGGEASGALQALLDQYAGATRGDPVPRAATQQGFAASLFYVVTPAVTLATPGP